MHYTDLEWDPDYVMRIKRTDRSPLALGPSGLAELYAMEDFLIAGGDLMVRVREQGGQSESMRTCSNYQHIQHLRETPKM